MNSNEKVAKLFASKTKPNVENEVIYKALNQSLNAMVYLRHKGSIIPPIPRSNNRVLSTVELPIILCNSFDKFYRVEIEDSSKPEKIIDNFQLEVNYAYVDTLGNNKSEYFLLDVVDFNNLDKFLDVLEKDIEAIYQVM